MSVRHAQKDSSLDISIRVKHLSKKFGKTRAVDDISFDIQKGHIVGFVGPNGAGKTTTISMLMGFLNSSEGSIAIHGKTITPRSAHTTHKYIGYVAGDMELFDNLTAEQYLNFLKNRYGSSERQKELIKRFQPKFGEKLKHLSRGNKQKVALIGAFQHSPSIAILDEPTSGLDPLMQETFLKMIKEEQARGATVFMSSHILNEVASICDRVMFMKKGKVVTDQPVKALEDAAGKSITIVTSKPDIKSIATHLLDGASLISKTDHMLKLGYKGDIKRFLRWINTHPISDITITDLDLDDIFHDLYKEEDEL